MIKKNKPKILAFYLPQYHEIPENNKWWGKGFTEWVNVKNSSPIFKGHQMPRVPLNENYYSLLNPETMIWQASLAKKYGIYGFVIYHYWYTEGMLLEKPLNLLLEHKEISMPFCICWANHSWTRGWVNKSEEVLRKQTYGNEKEWKRHFEYLCPFFKDARYIKIDGKPVFIIYLPDFKEFRAMKAVWEAMAKKNGFPGIFFLQQNNIYERLNDSTRGGLYDGGIEYQPGRAMREYRKRNKMFIFRRAGVRIGDMIPVFRCEKTSLVYSYKKLWKYILNQVPADDKSYPGAFVDYDNTPRKKNRGTICTGVSPELFYKYLSRQIWRTENVYKKEFLFLFAWNEWGESGYMEPDEQNGYRMLEAVKQALSENGIIV